MDHLIIIPTYNEHDNIRPLIQQIFAAVPETHVLFVDDGSPDGTGDLIDTLCKEDKRIHVLHRSEKQGLGKAYIAGFGWMQERSYRRIVTMDADLSHQPSEIPAMFDALHEADFAVGSRYVGGIRVINWPLYRLFLSKGAATYARLMTGLPVRDPTSGFMAFHRTVLDHFKLEELEASGYSFLIEMKFTAWRMGFKVVEVPITFIERVSGESKMNGAIIGEAMRIVAKLVFRKGVSRFAPRKIHPASVVKQGKPGNG